MGRIKTILTAAGLSMLLTSTGAAQNQLSRDFAECAGRMSAEMEHAWLMARDSARRFEAERAAFLTLLDAVAAQDEARNLLIYRIETKIAHAALLTSADFGIDTQRAARAKVIAHKRVATCRRMLLGA